MWNKEIDKVSSGIEVTLKELIDLRAKVVHSSFEAQKKWFNLPGLRLSNIRGRGIEFDATREYQPGDDIRSMAWRVTARSLKPHIKMYHEERERPVWLALDLSPSLFFGTRCRFKSVSIIRQATLLGWSYLNKRERIGTVIANQAHTKVYKPRACEQSFLTILNSMSECSRNLPEFSAKNYLHDLLLTLQNQVRSGNLIFILSDFFHFDAENQKLLLYLAQRAQVVMIFVYDQFEAEAPPPHQYTLTDGQKSVNFNMNNVRGRIDYQQQFEAKKNDLINFARKHNIAFQILRTDQKD